MFIKLKNFRCHMDATFTIPDSGLILLSGASGSGKSTLLKAVLYALFGVKAVKKPYSFGATTCSVTIEDFMGMVITRTNKPNRLVVETRDVHLEDEPAQAYINEKVHGNYDEFMISSYIPQKNNTSVLSLSQLEQIRLIKTLAIEERNYKEVIKSMINRSTTTLTKREAELSLIQEELENTHVEPVKKPIDISPDEFTVRLNSYNKKIGALLKAKDYAQKYETAVQLQEKLDDIPDDINAVMEDIESSISSLEAEKQYAELEAQYNEIVETERREREERIATLKADLWTDCNQEETVENIDVLKEYNRLTCGLDEVTKEHYETLKKRLAELEEKQIATESVSVKCPECETELNYYKGELHHKKEVEASGKNFKGEIKKCKDQITRLEEALEIELPEKTLKEYETYLRKNRDIEGELKRLERRQVSPAVRNLQRKMSLVKDRIKDDVKGDLEELRERKHTLKAQAENYNKYKTELSRLKIDLSVKPEVDIEDRLAKLEEEQEKDEALRPLVEKYVKYREKRAEYKKWAAKLDEAEVVLKNAEKKHRANLTLKERYQRAELLALEGTIDSINEHTKHYLDTFFPDDGLTATLKCVNKGKMQNLKVDVEIEYKGHVYDNITQLSGGEFDRCTLASICGINTMLASPILILDESLASLDTDTNTEIIHFLKELAEDKLVLVCSHEAVRGIFDQIITF